MAMITAAELLGTAYAVLIGLEELVQASPYGHTGTVIVTLAAAVIAVAAAVIAWRGIGGTTRIVAATLTFLAAGLVLMLTISLLTSSKGHAMGFSIVLAPGTVFLFWIGRAVLQAPAGGR
ncbi:hypothetical protein ACWT_5646 [Actinoplanes sp. SE50]|uniref:hypothetical protein n=1 Tax=unclassified Actinoplanes TaxID=2626549 RepID=UPI00023ED10A|nr:MULTISPECIES: hypothetical protein [unclassified Actinoplanes]AEV86663.1 hypothetical protein ACPL_5776 [Actinoplanes sp. SE50/110]ATO85061.1 hypothetical protein ACWT_5646 [Actinoplanes sp. SE50]SLM02472.1 hypothetical protein ACSP50_5722 [Actinoplanes sp. SE50/110]